ncbi:XrtA/PEP-CTERM system TPR-repeat protein PrsT [Roseateles asaccharophilus]|uniref:PEP-CTERM system TPR-repeat lipoprotein n=1 Tax=Roseateles asaccharophilus TaxID=582607 RepID=A0ABU2A5B8_9BURK|nr:XrtA/PEP-CTERM system TPR-repeat protein PrsT [Roseateles asaccharophilus]MDR7332393.1 putative PEP-CTERM system TPR-repeat lipoprotein [Roseateles asaccharophilus]
MTRLPHTLPALLAALLIATTAQAQDAAKAARFYEDALQRYEKRDIPGAIVQLRNALQADKNQLSVHVLLGKALLANSQPAAAEVAFNDALRLGVNRAEVVVPLAMALSAQGRQPQMLEDPRLLPSGLPPGVRQSLLLERALAQSDLGDVKMALASVLEARALNANDPGSWVAELPLRVRARQFNEALAAADQALKLAPNDAEALYQRGATLHAMGQVTQALATYDKIVQLSPKHADTRLARAGIYVDLDRDADALAEVNELLRLKPRDPRGTYLQALLAERAGRPADTKKSLKALTELLDPVPIEHIRFRPQLLMLNGLAHFGLGELEKARPYLELASRQQAGNPLNKLLAQIALAEPNPGRAADLLEAYVKARPGDGQALQMLASTYMSQGKHDRAASLMQEALKTRDAAEYRTTLGLSLLHSGKDALALDELTKAYAQDPKRTQAGLALATALLRDGQLAKALNVVDGLARANPENATVVMIQAYAKAQAGDHASARAGYEKAMALSPSLLEARLGLARVDIVTRNFDAAHKRLRDMLKTSERNVTILFELALLNEQWGKDDEALKWLESAAEASGPRETQANFALVAWHLRKGAPARALEAAKVLLSKLPDDPQALQAYAAAQAGNGDTTGPKSTLTNASRRAGFDSPRLVDIARQQLLIKDFSGAAYSLEKALSGTPGFVPALALFSSVEMSRGDITKAEQWAQQVVRALPKSPTGYNLLADAATRKGMPAAALDALRKAYDVDKSSQSLSRLIRAHGSYGSFRPAADLAAPWLQKNPNDIGVRSALAETLVRQRDFRAAKGQYEAILKTQPSQLDALNNLANVLIEMNNAEAVEVAERGLKVDARNILLLDTAGWAHHRLGSNDRALQLLRDARLRAPENAAIRYHLAAALAKAGRKSEARDEANAALQSSVNSDTAEDARKLLATLN